jgi:hypothetical protein
MIYSVSGVNVNNHIHPSLLSSMYFSGDELLFTDTNNTVLIAHHQHDGRAKHRQKRE